MRKQLYWLSDAEWKRLEPLLPRGRRGAHRVDDRRIISGIMHMLRSGARWRDCPPEYGPDTTIYNRFNRWSRQGIWFEMFEARPAQPASLVRWRSIVPTSKHIARQRAEKGDLPEAIGRLRGGRTTKIHALTDAEGRPRVLLLSPGNVNDIALAPALLAGLARSSISSPIRPTTPTACDGFWPGKAPRPSYLQRPAETARSLTTKPSIGSAI